MSRGGAMQGTLGPVTGKPPVAELIVGLAERIGVPGVRRGLHRPDGRRRPGAVRRGAAQPHRARLAPGRRGLRPGRAGTTTGCAPGVPAGCCTSGTTAPPRRSSPACRRALAAGRDVPQGRPPGTTSPARATPRPSLRRRTSCRGCGAQALRALAVAGDTSTSTWCGTGSRTTTTAVRRQAERALERMADGWTSSRTGGSRRLERLSRVTARAPRRTPAPPRACERHPGQRHPVAASGSAVPAATTVHRPRGRATPGVAARRREHRPARAIPAALVTAARCDGPVAGRVSMPTSCTARQDDVRRAATGGAQRGRANRARRRACRGSTALVRDAVGESGTSSRGVGQPRGGRGGAVADASCARRRPSPSHQARHAST